MRWHFCLILCVGYLAPASLTSAQEAAIERLEIGESGSAYLRSIRLRRIDTDVAYFDPSAPPPPLDTSQKPEVPPEATGGRVGIDRVLMVGITAAILAAIAYIFIRYGGGISVALSRGVQNADSARSRTKFNAPARDAKPGSLESLLRIGDRRRALVSLAQSALEIAVAANGVLLQRSWTARDALRHIPQEQHHLDALRALVMASERVQFGGRDVTEDEFEAHVLGVRPLFGRGGA